VKEKKKKKGFDDDAENGLKWTSLDGKARCERKNAATPPPLFFLRAPILYNFFSPAGCVSLTISTSRKCFLLIALKSGSGCGRSF
jgi:hypothetical protein